MHQIQEWTEINGFDPKLFCFIKAPNRSGFAMKKITKIVYTFLCILQCILTINCCITWANFVAFHNSLPCANAIDDSMFISGDIDASHHPLHYGMAILHDRSVLA